MQNINKGELLSFAPDKPRSNDVPTEGDLRALALERVAAMDEEEKDRLAYRVNSFFAINGSHDLQDLLTESILGAERSDHWGSGKRIKVGYYSSAADYFSILFHECAHKLLSSMGRTNDEYLSDFRQEEKFCWQLSRYLCRQLDLPYSYSREAVSRLTVLMLAKLSANNRGLSNFTLSLIRMIETTGFGYSRLSKNQINWDEAGNIRRVTEVTN